METLVIDKPTPVTLGACLVTFDHDGKGNNKMTGRILSLKQGAVEKSIIVHYDWNENNEVVNKFDDMNFGNLYKAELKDGTKCLLYAKKKYVAVKHGEGRYSQEKLSYSLLPIEQAEKYVSDTNGDRGVREFQLMDECFS